MPKPITNRLAQQLVLKTLLQLRSDLTGVDPHAPPTHAHARACVLERALARMVGAVGGQEAENTLWAILGVNARYDFGAGLRAQAESNLTEARRAAQGPVRNAPGQPAGKGAVLIASCAANARW